MKKLNLVLLSVEDWQGLYVNGTLKDQGHSVDLREFLDDIVGEEIMIESFESEYLELSEDNEDLCKYGNRFPIKLEEVIEYQLLKQQ